MIAAVKWWYAAFAALWLLPPPPAATAADDLPGAVRELARRTVSFAGSAEPIAVTWRNSSSLSSTEMAQAREAFEGALRGAGIRVSEAAAIDTRITISENRSQYLLVEEVRRGDDRQVWIAGWTRPHRTPMHMTGVTLEKQLLWEQDEPILDVAVAGDTMLLLAPDKFSWFHRQNGQWQRAYSNEPPELKRSARDPRGRLRPSGAGFEAYLPGVACKAASISPTVECKTADEPWILESGARFLLVANFAPGRNYFDGRIVTQTGVRKTIAPFYSAAALEENGKTLCLTATVDGRTQILDAAWEPAESITSWGSDIAGIDTRCGAGPSILATRTGDGHENDAIQAFTIRNRAAVPIGSPLDNPGPVTALWTSGGISATAVVRDLETGRYAAYHITVACGS